MGGLKKFAGLLAIVGAMASSQLAHAAVSIEPAVAPLVDVSTADVSAPALGQVSPTLTFSFVEDYGFTSLLLLVDYVPSKLSFNDALSTAVFHPFGLPSFTLDDLVTLSGGDFFYSENPSTPGSYTLLVESVSSQMLPAGSSLVLTGVFDLVGLPVGESTPVAMSGILTSTVADVDPSAINAFAVSAAVTAVPEPESWLMMLAGLGLLASRVRRRTR